jgi:hypothetical protein
MYVYIVTHFRIVLTLQPTVCSVSLCPEARSQTPGTHIELELSICERPFDCCEATREWLYLRLYKI